MSKDKKQHDPKHSGNIDINQFIFFYVVVMKISKLEIIEINKINQPLCIMHHSIKIFLSNYRINLGSCTE